MKLTDRRKLLLTNLLLACVLIGVLPSCAFAANHYVRQGASGNGSDWTNAYGNLPPALTRGDTYYIADGSYGSYTFDDAESGTQYITIKKAIEGDHGISSGWNSSYGDNAASFTSWTFNASYWDIDGQIGGGPGSWKDGYGFEVYNTATSCSTGIVLVWLGAGVSDIRLAHTKIYSDYDGYQAAGVKGINGASNITISHCRISDVFGVPFHIGDWSDSTIEFSYIYHNKSTGAGGTPCPNWHSEGVSSVGTNDNIIIRHNIWDRIEGTAVLAGVNVGSSTNWKVYGNIFSRSAATIYYYWEVPGTNQNSMHNLRFYNNNIVSEPGYSQGGIAIQAGSGNFIQNNIWYNNIANTFAIAGTHGYNYFSYNRRVSDCNPPCDRDAEGATGDTAGQINSADTSPFVNYQTDPTIGNFTLASATDAGISLLAPYNTDPLGRTRGSDGTWDRGAYEFVSGSQDIIPPNVPSGLNVQ